MWPYCGATSYGIVGGKVPESEAWSDDDDDVGLNVLRCRVDQGLGCGFGAYFMWLRLSSKRSASIAFDDKQGDFIPRAHFRITGLWR